MQGTLGIRGQVGGVLLLRPGFGRHQLDPCNNGAVSGVIDRRKELRSGSSSTLVLRACDQYVAVVRSVEEAAEALQSFGAPVTGRV